MNALALILRREIRLSMRQAGDSAIIVLFFVLAAILFPFGVGPEPNMLARMAPGVVWVTALLAAMLSFERLFAPDYEDGSLEQLALGPAPLETVALAKAAAHWLTTGFPLMIAAPLIALLYRLPDAGYNTLLITMALGTPTISLIGTVGAALTLGARRGGVLLSLLVIPLIIPILIFGTAAIDAAIGGYPFRQHLLLLGGFFLGALVLTPIATAAALRQALE
ncbi:MAG: heme exporter protein CcmB [Rhodospirillaceae bacterium]|nr:heme exporter protein CcmB [Rhodospirillaceae bacterium]|tara:strand:+ start:824 stop:1489 length:666 start_codon:yes stop_codon:yes gene_type:complete